MNKIKELRKGLKLSQKELSSKIGIAQSTLSTWENGVFEPDSKTLMYLADFFGVSTDYLLGKSENKKDISLNLSEMSNIITFDKFKSIPIIGTIACGTPILAEENIDGYTRIESSAHADFGLKCKGDSMSPKFLNDDIVIIRQQPMVENGQVAAVLIGEEATLKRVYLYEHKIILAPENLNYEPLVFQDEEMNNVKIIGLAVGFTRFF